MKVIVAIDSFKGSLTSLEAGEAAREGILRAMPDAEVVVRPMADGGEGTLEALVTSNGGSFRSYTVHGPLGEPVEARCGAARGTAILEMASASGLCLIDREKRDPLRASTRGTGELIAALLREGCRDFIIGIGGSATNDGGAGMLCALGFSLLDCFGAQIPEGALGLEELCRVDTSTACPALRQSRFRVICDVNNPLCGENGASMVYGAQKGADEKTRRRLDTALCRFADKTASALGRDVRDTPGAGAAGGIGFGLMAYLGAELLPGIDVVLKETRLEEYLAGADVLVTGEGRIDLQTSMGKAPAGAAALAKKHGLKTVAFAGGVTRDARACNAAGIDAFFPIVRGVTTIASAMETDNAKANLADAAEQAFRLIAAARS